MCETHASADHLLRIYRARVALDELVEGATPVAKALSLSSPDEFDRAVAVLAAELRSAAGTADVDAVRAAVAVLDVDWPVTTAAERGRLVNEAMVAARRSVAIIPTRIQVPLGDAAESVVNATRQHSRQTQGLAIGANLNALDRRVTEFVTRSQGLFVRDEYGRRVDAFGAEARRIVNAGLEQGLGRTDMARALDQAARAALIERAPIYWEVVASAFVGQGRSLAQMSSYAEAGVERYVIEAVLDEATTQVCRYLHGKVFSVGAALERFDRVQDLERPEDIKRELPWIREGRDPESGLVQLYVGAGTTRTPIAEVTRSALGTRDDPGSFRSLAGDAALRDLGISFPPFHGLCRTTVMPVV